MMNWMINCGARYRQYEKTLVKTVYFLYHRFKSLCLRPEFSQTRCSRAGPDSPKIHQESRRQQQIAQQEDCFGWNRYPMATDVVLAQSPIILAAPFLYAH